MTKDEALALDLALEALETLMNGSGFAPAENIEKARKAITAIRQARSAPVQDAEGENKAVRSFLMLYGQPGLTVGQMKKHMDTVGFKSWPAWVETEPHGAHLTKAGAQLWIRHLFALEATPPTAQPSHGTDVRTEDEQVTRSRTTGLHGGYQPRESP